MKKQPYLFFLKSFNYMYCNISVVCHQWVRQCLYLWAALTYAIHNVCHLFAIRLLLVVSIYLFIYFPGTVFQESFKTETKRRHGEEWKQPQTSCLCCYLQPC